MAKRFLAEIAEQARADLSEALDGTAQSISKKLITQAADTEESSLNRTLETEARNADSFTSTLSKLDGRGAEATSGVSASAARSATAGADESASSQAAADAEKMSASSEREAQEQARLKGEDGATDDPIDLVTGEMFLPQTDLSLPGTLPLVLERCHATAYRNGRLFGTTWSSTLDQRIAVDDDGIHFAGAGGRILHYPVPTVRGQSVLPSHGPRWPLMWDRSEDRIVIGPTDDGLNLWFPPGPVPQRWRPMSAITDRAGNRITFVYDADAVPTDVYHSGGYHVVVKTIDTRGGTRVSALELADPSGGADQPVREFRYDLAGRLVETYRPGSDVPLVFEYDDADRVTRWIDRNGYDYRYHYREDGRVSRAEGADGFLSVRLDYDLSARTTTQTDALGHTSVYHWNERMHAVKSVDPLGHATLTEKDRYGNALSGTDPLGRTVSIQRNEFGDPVRIARADGSTVGIAYDERRLPTAATGPDGATWQYVYDERGALTVVTDPAGGTTSYARDERGALASYTDQLGNTTTIVPDKAGLPLQITDPRGGSVRLRRDPFGRVAEITDRTGAVTRLEWDVDGRLLARLYGDGTHEAWSYDQEGNLLTYTSPSGAVTSFEYGPFDLPVARIDADGAIYRFTYDQQLRLTEVTNPRGQKWCYEYDAAGGLIAETDFNGSRRTYILDAAGQLVRQEGAAGQVVEFDRDLLGRATTRTSGTTAYQYTYDSAGRLTRAAGQGVVLEYTYDPLGRVLSEAVNGRVVANSYDPAGRRTTRTTPSGVVSRWAHDAVGNPLELTGTGGFLGFTFDDAGRETARMLGPTASLTKAYDVVGRLTGQAVWSFDQPCASRAQATAPGGAWSQVQTRTYTYGADGQLLEIADELRGTRSYTLDAAGRATAVVAASWREGYAYDVLGNLARTETPDLPAPAALDTAGEREHDGTLVRRAGRTTYEHDAAGRLVRQRRRTLSGGQLVWSYAWDDEDRLVHVATPHGESWQYTYDPLGRRFAKTRSAADGSPAHAVYFTWDGPHLAEEARIDQQGRTTTVTWDYEPGTFTPAAQTTRSWAADATKDEIDTEFHAIVTDLIGSPQELVTPDGRIVWRASHTLWGFATGPAPGSTADCPLRFPGQYYDDETGLHYNCQRYYDPSTGAYLSPDPLGLVPAPNHHAYVANPLTEFDPLGLAAYIHTSVAYQDYVTKGAHVHIGNREVRIFPNHEGGISGSPLTVKGVTASADDVAKVLDALKTNPSLREDTISKLQSVMEGMNRGDFGRMAVNHALQMRYLIVALRKMGQS